MKEDFLHFLWRTRRFAHQDLFTTDGEPIIIISYGDYNSNAGPDFLNARIHIGGTLWAGNVEMHVNASDWLRHGHTADQAYNSVILHVAWEEDAPIFRESGEKIPCLTLKNRIAPGLYANYRKLMHQEQSVPCRPFLDNINDLTINLWLERLGAERLEQKTTAIAKDLEHNNGNWEETFYQYLAKNFGLKVNASPFEVLAKKTPLHILKRHANHQTEIEAILLGQAGFLEGTFEEEYVRKLQKEYHFQQKKYGLESMEVTSWKFLRLRPANFPTLRIAQLSALLHQSTFLFSRILETDEIKEIEELFSFRVSDYWQNHYHIGKPSIRHPNTLGRDTVYLFIINTIAPFLFLYGKRQGEESYKEKAIRLLEQLPPENNAIIRDWENTGLPAKDAYRTQSLLQLRNEYCNRKKCLHCGIGTSILKPTLQ